MLRVREFLADKIAGKIPIAQGLAGSGRCFPESEQRLRCRFQALCRNRYDRVDDVGLIAVENLNHVAFGTGIVKFQYVLAGIEKSLPDLNRLIDREDRHLVPFVRSSSDRKYARCEDHTAKQAQHRSRRSNRLQLHGNVPFLPL